MVSFEADSSRLQAIAYIRTDNNNKESGVIGRNAAEPAPPPPTK